MEIVNSSEAKTHLSKLIRRALEGERIIIARAGKPLVELRPYREPQRRVGGIWKDRVHLADDFDESLKELEHELYGDDSSTR